MADLNTDIRYIKGIGETRAKALQKLGVTTLGDLLSYFPRRWEDRTLERPIRWVNTPASGPCWPATPPPAASPEGARW